MASAHWRKLFWRLNHSQLWPCILLLLLRDVPFLATLEVLYSCEQVSFSESPFRICTTMADPMTDLMDNHMTDPMTDLIIMTVSIHDSLDSLHDTLAMFCQNIRLTLIMPRVILMV